MPGATGGWKRPKDLALPTPQLLDSKTVGEEIPVISTPLPPDPHYDPGEEACLTLDRGGHGVCVDVTVAADGGRPPPPGPCGGTWDAFSILLGWASCSIRRFLQPRDTEGSPSQPQAGVSR